MNNRYLKGLRTKDEKDDRRRLIDGSVTYMRVLNSILMTMKEEELKKMMASGNYSMPSWSEYQADKMGALRTLDNIMALMHTE